MAKKVVGDAIRPRCFVGESSHQLLEKTGIDGLDLLGLCLGSSLEIR